MTLDDSENPLAVEIRQEAADAYFAACKRMVAALGALQAFDSAAPGDSGMARRTELLEEAAERVYFVIIQREAMKLAGSEYFFEQYDVPGEVRACLRPRRNR